MFVQVGDLFKHVNVDEPYLYKAVYVYDETTCTEDRHLVIVHLENSVSGITFEIRGDQLAKYYESKTIYPVIKTCLDVGDTVGCFDNSNKYVCTQAWMWELYEMAYDLKDKATNLTISIQEGDLKRYYRIQPPETFNEESWQQEQCATIIALLREYLQITLASRDKLGPWLDKMSAYSASLLPSKTFLENRFDIAFAVKNFGRHHHNNIKNGLYRSRSVSAYERFIKDIFYRLSLHYLCD